MEHTSRIPKGRQHLAQLVANAGDVIKVDDAVRILDLDRTAAAKILARWTDQGWLRRVRRGFYVPASLDSLGSQHVIDDPWVLVPGLYEPAYVGGRTAAEYWDLTEQIFNDTVVMTSKPLRFTSQQRHGVNFTLKHLHSRKIFGCKTVWRERTKVMVSDLQRTVVDMLDDPAMCGGIQQVSDCLEEYFKRSDRNDRLLLEYGERLGNGAVFKRLGILAERRGENSLVLACLDRLTKGTVKLDPSLDCPNLVTRWRIWVPARWKREELA